MRRHNTQNAFKTIDSVLKYAKLRIQQLKRYDYSLINQEVKEWGLNLLFEKNNKTYQSIILLDEFTGNGLYKTLVTNTIVTFKSCNIYSYLEKNNIDFVCYDTSVKYYKEYKLISEYYGSKIAKRSGVRLMNHIDEGLYILEQINASENAKRAYCLHPIFQGDEDLINNFVEYSTKNISNQVIALVMEYRSVANDYLSTRNINSLDEIRLSPLKDVNDMLIADKIQNKKDFDLYHLGTHLRSNELSNYFNNWLNKLEISSEFYKEIVDQL